MSESSDPIGPTGKFPDGKIRPDDKGELNIGIAADKTNNVVVLRFNTPTIWFAAPPDVMRELARLLVENAKELDGKEA